MITIPQRKLKNSLWCTTQSVLSGRVSPKPYDGFGEITCFFDFLWEKNRFCNFFELKVGGGAGSRNHSPGTCNDQDPPKENEKFVVVYHPETFECVISPKPSYVRIQWKYSESSPMLGFKLKYISISWVKMGDQGRLWKLWSSATWINTNIWHVSWTIRQPETFEVSN